MHDCPFCGQACDCDGEDTWFDNYPDCNCPCEDLDYDDDEFDGDWDEDDAIYPDAYGECLGCGKMTPDCTCDVTPSPDEIPVPVAEPAESEPADFVIVHDPERAAWLREIGLDPERVPIKSLIASWVNVPERGEQLAYELDITRLTGEQREKLAAHLAQKFNHPVEEVIHMLPQVGCPILTEGTTAISTQPYKYL